MSSGDFLDLIENLDARDLLGANAPRDILTRDEPAYNFNVSFTRSRRATRGGARYKRAVRECARLIDRVRARHLPSMWLYEAMSTSDFQLIFSDIIDRQLLGFWAEVPPVWRNFFRVGTLRDLRTANTYYMDGGEGQLLPVAELGEYKAANLTPGLYARKLGKYGRVMGISLEMIINDDLEAITDIPRRFARAARRTEAKLATGAYVSASGPHSSFYTSGNKNIINIANGASANNPPLSITGLQDGLRVLAKMVDTDGEPIVVEAVELVVPPALELIAQNILSATEIRTTAASAGGATNIELTVANWMRNRVRLSVDPYIPQVASTANGDTSWWLFASSQSERPALAFDHLAGREQPQLFIKSADAVRVGGGNVDPLDGEFDHDEIRYKVRHFAGASRLEPKATVASNGTGS